MKKLPPGISIMPAWHACAVMTPADALGRDGGTIDAPAAGPVIAAAAAGVARDPLMPSTRTAPTIAATPATPRAAKTPTLLDPGRRTAVDDTRASDGAVVAA